MIKYSNKVIDSTLNFLNSYYPTKEDVYIRIAYGYDSIEVGEDKVFGVYVPQEKAIWVGSEIPYEDCLIKTIAHEFMHFIQDCNGEEFNEEKADKFGELVYQGMEELGWLDVD